jgi:transcription initiation factor TFIIE subunit beta
MWSEIRIPDETDLPKALETAGLKTMEVFEKKVTSEVRKKQFLRINFHLTKLILLVQA